MRFQERRRKLGEKDSFSHILHHSIQEIYEKGQMSLKRKLCRNLPKLVGILAQTVFEVPELLSYQYFEYFQVFLRNTRFFAIKEFRSKVASFSFAPLLLLAYVCKLYCCNLAPCSRIFSLYLWCSLGVRIQQKIVIGLPLIDRFSFDSLWF